MPKITYEERKVIERELKKGTPIVHIASKLGVHRNAINYEIRRSGFTRDNYNAKEAQLKR